MAFMSGKGFADFVLDQVLDPVVLTVPASMHQTSAAAIVLNYNIQVSF